MDGGLSMSFSEGSKSSGGSVGLLVASMLGTGVLAVAVGSATSRVAEEPTAPLVVVCGVEDVRSWAVSGASPLASSGGDVVADLATSAVSNAGAEVVTTELAAAGDAVDRPSPATAPAVDSSAVCVVVVLAAPLALLEVVAPVLPRCSVGSMVGSCPDSGHGSWWSWW